jgi:signal transduction histidine kinase
MEQIPRESLAYTSWRRSIRRVSSLAFRAVQRARARRRVSGIEHERRRIACELHDELGQLLISLRMSIALSGATTGDATKGDERKNGQLALVDATIRAMRDISLSLRPTMLDEGLLPALEWLTRRFSIHTGIQCTLDFVICERDLEEDQKAAIFRIAQESLTNAARHGRATDINVTVIRAVNNFVLEVMDNGRGFDLEHIPTVSLGLTGMRERALAAGGDMVVNSRPLEGTVVRASFPRRP